MRISTAGLPARSAGSCGTCCRTGRRSRCSGSPAPCGPRADARRSAGTRGATSQSEAPSRSSTLIAVYGSLMPGESARTATSTSWRTANSRSVELTRVAPSAMAPLDGGLGAGDGLEQERDRGRRERRSRRAARAGGWPCRSRRPSRPGPRRRAPAGSRGAGRRRVAAPFQNDAGGGAGGGLSTVRRSIARRTSSLTSSIDGVDVDAPGHVADEVHEHRDADEGEQDADAQRQVRREGALVLRAHAAQHHQRIREGAEEGAERDLHAAVAGEVAQQPRAHLAGRERERGDGDREHRAGDADRRRGDGAEQRSCARAAAVVDPLALDEPLRRRRRRGRDGRARPRRGRRAG